MSPEFGVDNYGDSREFNKYVGEFFATRTNCPISATLRLEVQKITAAHLGVSDFFQVRDRFEGQQYYNNLLLKISALYLIEKSTSLTLINWNVFSTERRLDLAFVTIRNTKYRLVPFFYGSLPAISNSWSEPLLLCAIRTDFKSGIICGTLVEYDLDDARLFVWQLKAHRDSKGKFIGFEYLQNLV